MKQVIDTARSMASGAGGSIAVTALPETHDTVTVVTKTVITVASVIGSLWPILKPLFAKKKKA